MSIGDKIRALRKEKGLTQLELAEAVGVRCQYITMIERGTKALSIQLGKQIAEVLECSVEDFCK